MDCIRYTRRWTLAITYEYKQVVVETIEEKKKRFSM